MEENTIQISPATKATAFPAKWIVIVALTLVLVIGGFFAWRGWNSQKGVVPTTQVETISFNMLEERYGLRVRLIGVTAAGGMIDFRLKIMDTEKAKQILTHPEKIPSLIIPESGVTLTAPANPVQDLVLVDGGIYFILFGNKGGIVRPGTPVIVSFGEFQLEPLPAQ